MGFVCFPFVYSRSSGSSDVTFCLHYDILNGVCKRQVCADSAAASLVKLSTVVSPVKVSTVASSVKVYTVVSMMKLSVAVSPVKLSVSVSPVKLFCPCLSEEALHWGMILYN
ncbi:unnamed protein product [Eruca vesicaria subsp. sativa]|uniref:Secreted protein n=1 Tax=Eruca vesicaria subsp. sativa TaxID=29727 RepID=A0ABC8L486_ERUVS|nr:unnamed protein product [Eruca vesicaria subsp. sativa]